MSEITRIIGERIRHYRLETGLTQEQLAERAGLHYTYIGQLERDEKNATIETIEKVAIALGISLEIIFRHLGAKDVNDAFASECYEAIHALTEKDQLSIKKIIQQITDFKMQK